MTLKKRLGQMRIKFKIFKKVISIILAVLLFINPLVVPIVYAEGEEPTPTPTEQLTPTPTPTEIVSPVADSEVTPTAVPQSTITTGDANASSTIDTTVNNNKDTVDESLATPIGSCSPPEGQTNCPDDIGIGNSSQATVSGTTDSSANTGGNQESGSAGNASVDTGDATASGQITNDINSNMVVATASPTLSLTPTPTGSVSPEGSPPNGQEQPADLKVTNENDGKLTNTADISANTGDNVASENLGDVDLKTGDALAWLNLLNFLNINIVGSNFEFMILNIKNDSGEIDLNELWKQLQEQNSSDSVFLVGDQSSSNLRLIINNKNNADLENNVNVCAITGDNQANQNNSAQIDTGDATALANIINMINANILGSKFFFGIINITGQFKGNLILPRPERFLGVGGSAVGGEGAIFSNQNFANVNDTLATSANTGGNQENNGGGNNTVNTGDAGAFTSDLSLINLNLYKNDWFYLLMNILGSWNGKTYGWSNPDAAEEVTEQSQTYQTTGNQSSANVGSTSPVDFQNQNIANVKNNVNVSASTGGNQANENAGGASIKTGKAKAVLNLLNLINLNILASRWFMGLVNVLGSWTGNTIFAYPDLVVSLSGNPDEVSPGDSFEYVLSFGNQGYDDADAAVVKMEFPKGLSYEGDDSGMQANCSSQNCSWNVGNLKRSQGGSFRIRVKLDPNFFSLGNISFWEKLIPKVYAAENTLSFVVKALITTTIPESDNNNNVSERKTGVKVPAVGGVNFAGAENQKDEVDQRQPVLEITAKNNVGAFVYPGDIVTFEITVWNKGEVASQDTYLTQALYDGDPEDFGKANIKIGTIKAGKKAKVSFGIVLSNDGVLDAGPYYTITKAIGYAPNGNKVSSNEARTDFNIRLREIASVFEARAAAKEEEKVLGIESECPEQKDKILPYVLLFILSSLWIVDRGRRISERYLLKK